VDVKNVVSFKISHARTPDERGYEDENRYIQILRSSIDIAGTMCVWDEVVAKEVGREAVTCKPEINKSAGKFKRGGVILYDSYIRVGHLFFNLHKLEWNTFMKKSVPI